MTQTSHMQAGALLGAYALDALDTVHERASVESHLAACEECRQELAGHLEVAAMLVDNGVPPPFSVWTEILAEVRSGGEAEELAPVVSLQSRRSVGLRWVIGMAGAAAVFVVVLAAALLSQSGRISDLNAEVLAQEQQIQDLVQVQQTDPMQLAVTAALSSPGAQLANLTSDQGSAGMLIVVLPDGTGFVYESSLDQLPDDLTYQLWAVVDGKVISAGVLGNGPDIVPFHIDPQGLQGLVITQEVAGGVPVSEADPVVAWFDA